MGKAKSHDYAVIELSKAAWAELEALGKEWGERDPQKVLKDLVEAWTRKRRDTGDGKP